MKYFYAFLLVALLTGCHRSYIEFNGTVTGFTNGYFIIKDATGADKYKTTIEDGKFHLKTLLEAKGYHTMIIMADSYGQDKVHKGYDVYLEPGTYTIVAGQEDRYNYPSIKSTSDLQNQLTDYYTLANDRLSMAAKSVADASASMVDPRLQSVSGKSIEQLSDVYAKAIKAQKKIQSAILNEFITKYPQNQVAAHLLYQLDYVQDPADYNPVYQKFSADQKATDEGKEEGDKLGALMKLAPGATAPKLVGQTADGKPFDASTINKKLILVEFWRADNEDARDNHGNLTHDNFTPLINKDFTVVSVSLDTVKDVWKAAIVKDKMTWMQVCDLKGQSSPNFTNWQVGKIPTYYLVDDKWKILYRDISYGDVSATVDSLLHPKK